MRYGMVWLDKLRQRLYMKPCKDSTCNLYAPHTHHLTSLGYRHYVGHWPR